MPRDLLIKCGGFDELILAAEDLELGLRLWRMGVPFSFRPTAITHEHYVKTSWQYLNWQAATIAAGDIRICRKHPEYRPHSLLSSFAATRPSRRWLRRVLMQTRISPIPLIAFPLLFENLFYRFVPMRRAALHLLRIAERLTRLRSAVKAAGSWKALVDEFGKCSPSLMYHHVGPQRPGTFREWTVSTKQFERQMRWLARSGYRGITPSDWLRWRREGKELPEKPILITFDDAYADTAENALPILRQYGFSAAVFVVTRRIGETNTWDESQGSETLQLMTAEQIRYWAEQGFEFGSHSRTHPDLTGLSVGECLQEIAGSKKDLSSLLGKSVTSFAYPFGEHNQTVRDLVCAEFDLAFIGEDGMNFLKGDPHLLRRAHVGPDTSMIEFSLMARFGGRSTWIRNLRIKLALRSRFKRAFRTLISP
jgi:peptidoglycan/xylan/chitin deacetylase (PgdA/CDA1 family)